jgi:hypothetical protein
MVTESEPSPFCLPFWPDFCLPFWPEPYICYYICGVHKVFLAGMSLYSHIRCIVLKYIRFWLALYVCICTVYTRYFWQENYLIYNRMQCIYTVLANPNFLCLSCCFCLPIFHHRVASNVMIQ